MRDKPEVAFPTVGGCKNNPNETDPEKNDRLTLFRIFCQKCNKEVFNVLLLMYLMYLMFYSLTVIHENKSSYTF